MNPFDNWFQGLSQRQQGIQQQPGMINPAVMDAIQQQQAQQQMPQGQGSPLDSGSMSAINAMRESMSARPKKDIGFLGRLLNTAGNTLSNYSIASLRSSPSEQARLMGGMMLAPHEREAQEKLAQQNQFKENFTLMDYLEKQKKNQDEMAFEREKLEETKRHNNMLGDYYKRSGKGNGGGSSSSDGPYSEYPSIVSRKSVAEYESTLKGSNMALGSLGEIKKDFNKFKTITKDNWVAPTGSDIPFSRQTKDYLGRRNLTQGLKDEYIARKGLESKFARLEPVLEKGLKGSAAGEQLLKRFHNLQVYLNSDQPMDVIEDRLNDIISELSNVRDTTQLSLKYGKHIPYIPLDEQNGAEPSELQSNNKSASGGGAELVDRLKREYPELQGLNPSEVLKAYEDSRKNREE
jgi:hypothetical protein